MTLTHLDLDRIDGLAERLRESKAEVLRLLAKDAGSLKAASVIAGWIWDTDSALADLTAMITRIRELEGALEPFAALADDYLADTVNFDDDTIMAGRMTRRGEEGVTPPRVTFADFRRARAVLQQKGKTQ